MVQILIEPEPREFGHVHRAVVAIVFVLHDTIFHDLERPVEVAA